MTKCNKCADELPIGSYGKVRCEACNTVNDVPLPQEEKQKIEVTVTAPPPTPPPQEPKVKRPSKRPKRRGMGLGSWINISILIIAVLGVSGFVFYYISMDDAPVATVAPTAPPLPSLSKYDAIDLVPYEIKGYTTYSWETNTEPECHTSAVGTYFLGGTAETGAVVSICEAKDLSTSLKKLESGILTEEFMRKSTSKILLYGDIYANYAKHSSGTGSAVMLWWTQEDFILIVYSGDDEGNRDT